MRSTNRRLPSLILSGRRAEVTAFWMMTTAGLSLALAWASWAIGAEESWAWGASGLCVLAPGLVWPRWFETGISAWNKGVRLIASGLRAYVLKVSYYMLFAALARTGSSLDVALQEPTVSRWIPRLQSDVPFEHRNSSAAGSEWSEAGLLVSARRLRSAWMLCLLPVLWLLRLLPDERQESAPLRSTYTLY